MRSDGSYYGIRAHKTKTNLAIVSVGRMKRLVNASKNFVLMMVKMKNDEISTSFEECDPNVEIEPSDRLILLTTINN